MSLRVLACALILDPMRATRSSPHSVADSIASGLNSWIDRTFGANIPVSTVPKALTTKNSNTNGTLPPDRLGAIADPVRDRAALVPLPS